MRKIAYTIGYCAFLKRGLIGNAVKVGDSHRYCKHRNRFYRQKKPLFLWKWEGGDKGVSQETCHVGWIEQLPMRSRCLIFSACVSNVGNRSGFMLNSLQYLMEDAAFFHAFTMIEGDMDMEKTRGEDSTDEFVQVDNDSDNGGDLRVVNAGIRICGQHVLFDSGGL